MTIVQALFDPKMISDNPFTADFGRAMGIDSYHIYGSFKIFSSLHCMVIIL
jgi:hypothetical protein